MIGTSLVVFGSFPCHLAGLLRIKNEKKSTEDCSWNAFAQKCCRLLAYMLTKKNSKKRYGRIWEPGDFLCKDDAFMPPFEEMSHSSCLSPAMQAIIFGVKPDSNRMVMFV